MYTSVVLGHRQVEQQLRTPMVSKDVGMFGPERMLLSIIYMYFYYMKSPIRNGKCAALTVTSDSLDRYSLHLHSPVLFSPLALGS